MLGGRGKNDQETTGQSRTHYCTSLRGVKVLYPHPHGIHTLNLSGRGTEPHWHREVELPFPGRRRLRVEKVHQSKVVQHPPKKWESGWGQIWRWRSLEANIFFTDTKIWDLYFKYPPKVRCDHIRLPIFRGAEQLFRCDSFGAIFLKNKNNHKPTPPKRGGVSRFEPTPLAICLEISGPSVQWNSLLPAGQTDICICVERYWKCRLIKIT